MRVFFPLKLIGLSPPPPPPPPQKKKQQKKPKQKTVFLYIPCSLIVFVNLPSKLTTQIFMPLFLSPPPPPPPQPLEQHQ